MLHRTLKFIFLITCITMIMPAEAVFFAGEVLKKDDITVVILGDVHGDTSQLFVQTEKQINDLLEIAKKHNAYLIVEDLATKIEVIPKKITSRFETSGKLVLYGSPMLELCKRAKKEMIATVNSECRSLKGEVDPTIVRKIRSFNNSAFQTYLKNLETKRPLSMNDWLQLNTVYEIATKLSTKKLFIITVGAIHMKHISEMLINILNFKSILQKNYLRLGFKSLALGEPEKFREIQEKAIEALNEYALDLHQFFEEALSAPSIKSKL